MLLETMNTQIAGKLKMNKYHSSLSGYTQETASECSYFEWENSIAFYHDLCAKDELPDEFKKCDILYVEIPWQKGFNIFNERANINDKRTYELFLNHLSKIINNTDIPLVILCGKTSTKRLPKPFKKQQVINSYLKTNYPFNALFYNFETVPEFTNTKDFFSWGVYNFDCVGDFMCGYGLTGKHFLKNDKSCVLSDYNKTCIGYIAETMEGWQDE